MKFFTDRTVRNDFLLIKIGDYIKLKDFSRWKEIFIDPGVYELTKQKQYSWEKWLNIWEFLNSLPKNHFFSTDYPCDMNPKYSKEYIDWTYERNHVYNGHPNFIVTVQSKFRDYFDFVKYFDIYNALHIESGILALGNMCRFRTLNHFLKHSLDYAFSHCNHPRLHIYGLCFKAIPYANKLAKRFRIEFSFDSTKWTRACWQSGLPSCNKWNRQFYFDMYKKRLEEFL